MEDIFALKDVISDYDRFFSIAQQLEWIEIKEQHQDWYQDYGHYYPFRIYVDIFEFPEEYVQNNIIQAYVRTVFASMAIYEEWEDKDFWNHMTQKQRNSVNICETVNLDCFLSTKDLGEN